jgi:pimeloyl-ACP methyl ester carboxylesterase
MTRFSASDLHTRVSTSPSLQFLQVSLENIPEISQPQTAAYRRQGEGLPIVLLHGFLGDSANWQGVMAELATASQQNTIGAVDVIALDLLGFGASGKPPVKYTVPQEVAFLRAVLGRLGLERCILVGHSFGGWVAAAYAIAYPEQVQALCLVAPAGIRDDEFCGRYDWMRPVLWRTPIVDLGLWMLAPFAKLLGHSKTLATVTWARRELNRQPAARSFLVDRLRPEDAIDTVEHQIDQIQAPTLVLAAELDDTIPRWHCETYAERIANAQLTIVPGAEHGLPQQHPEAIVRSLTTLIPPAVAKVWIQP